MLKTEIPQANQDNAEILDAICVGDEHKLAMLLENKQGPGFRNSTSDVSFVIAAASQGKLSCLKLLVEQGASIRDVDYSGASGFHRACSSGHADVVSYLLGQGAVVSARTDSEETPLHWAVLSCDVTSMSAIFELLLKHGAEINAVNCHGETPLHLAASKNNQLAIKFLCLAGAKKNAMDTFFRSPLHVACSQSRRTNAVLALLEAGAEVADVHVLLADVGCHSTATLQIIEESRRRQRLVTILLGRHRRVGCHSPFRILCLDTLRCLLSYALTDPERL